jgi:single-strand DNA-binding protein
MASFNKITLVGNVGRDPELKQTATSKVVDFSIAINEPARGQQPERTEWYRVSFWDRRAETIAQYVRKGTQIMVEGRLSVRTYTDPNTQRERYSLEVTGTDFVLLGSRPSGEEGGTPAGGGYAAQSVQPAQPASSTQTSAPAPVPSMPSGPPPTFAKGGEEDDLPF